MTELWYEVAASYHKVRKQRGWEIKNLNLKLERLLEQANTAEQPTEEIEENGPESVI
jgi:hypothetical protein